MSGNLASGLLLLILGIWLFIRVWWGGLARQVSNAVTS